MKTLSLKLPDSLSRKLDIVVSRRKTTKSLIIREALEAHLGAGEGARKGTIKESIRDLVGIYQGPGDLSINPKYMDDFGK